MPSPKVSVIVPVWNGALTIGQCLEALMRQSLPQDHLQVIVVDNGSSDGTAEIVSRFESVLLLIEPHPGSYRARNVGLTRASGEVIAFTDADCIPALDWVEQGLRALGSDNKVGVAAGRIELVPAEPAELDSPAFLYEQLFAFRQEEAARSGHSVTANWMSPRSVFEEVGLFDANVKSGGDWLLSGRISSAGLVVRYVPEMVVRHPARSSSQELIAKRRRVVGGAWDRNGRRGPLRLITAVAADTSRKTKRAWSETRLGIADRARVIMMLWILSAAAVLEVVRLTQGHEPRR